MAEYHDRPSLPATAAVTILSARYVAYTVCTVVVVVRPLSDIVTRVNGFARIGYRTCAHSRTRSARFAAPAVRSCKRQEGAPRESRGRRERTRAAGRSTYLHGNWSTRRTVFAARREHGRGTLTRCTRAFSTQDAENLERDQILTNTRHGVATPSTACLPARLALAPRPAGATARPACATNGRPASSLDGVTRRCFHRA